jgi:hypothetical protein
MLFGIRNISIKRLPPAGEFLFETQGKGLKKNRESKYSQRSILGVEKEYLSKNSTNMSQKLTYFACAL